MYRYQQHISSQPFQELAYRALSNITAEQKKALDHEELKIFATEYALQKFCQEERMDHVMYMLAKVGIDWTFRISKDAFSADMIEFLSQDVLDLPKKRVDVTGATKREGVCIISSRDVMMASHIVAQNCTSKVYAVSQFSKDMAAKGRDLGQLTKWDKDIKEVEVAHDMFNDILLEQLNSLDYTRHLLGLEDTDIRILCALFKKRNASLKMGDISSLTRAKGRKMYFRKNVRKMLDMGYIATDAKTEGDTWSKHTFFMITSKGIGAVMSYRKYIFENTFGGRK